MIIITTLNDKKKTNQECYIGIVQYLGFKYSKALCFTNLKSRMKENKEWKLIIWLKKYKYSDVASYCTLDKKKGCFQARFSLNHSLSKQTSENPREFGKDFVSRDFSRAYPRRLFARPFKLSA